MADGWDYHIEQAGAALEALRSNRAYMERYLPEQRWLNWYDIADPFIEGNRLGLMLVHPGSGKSTLCSYVRILRKICKDRSIRAGYFSKTAAKASLFMSAVGRELHSNPQIYADFGPFFQPYDQDAVRNTEQIRVLGSTRSAATPTLINLGQATQFEGLRFDLLVLDDPIDIKTAMSAAETSRMDKLLGSLIDRLDPGGQLLIIGHRFLPNDFYQQVIESRPQFKVMILPAVHNPGNIYEPAEVGIILTADLWPRDTLLTEKKANHKAWEWRCWYQQIRESPEDATFHNIPMVFSPLQAPGPIYSAADPAYSTHENSDYSTAIAGAKLGERLLVTDIMDWRIAAGWSSEFTNFALRNGARVLQVEINNAQTLGEEMREDCRRQGLPLKVVDLRSKGKKEFRIGELADEAAKERILFAEHLRQHPALRRLAYEWDAYPNISHDDHLDVLEMLWRLVMGGPGPRTPTVRSATI